MADPVVRPAVDCYIGIGTNLGDRAGNVARAIELIGRPPAISVARVSRLYETPPWGVTDQPDFLNAAAQIRTTLGPIQLLIHLKRVEQIMGRAQVVRWGPRIIDLDILLYDAVQLRRRGLVIPHGRMHERAFVLIPLRDLLPTYHAPDGEVIDELIEQIEAERASKGSVRLYRPEAAG